MIGRGEDSDGQLKRGVVVEENKVMNDDPFELAPVIKVVMNEHKGKKHYHSKRWSIQCQSSVWNLKTTDQGIVYLQRQMIPALKGLPSPYKANCMKLLGYQG